MREFMITLGSMSLQAVIVIAITLVLRKLFEKLHIARKYMMLFWLIPFICLVCPWKFSAPVGFWQTSPADIAEEGIRQEKEWHGGSRPAQDSSDKEDRQESTLIGNLGTGGRQDAVPENEKEADKQKDVLGNQGGPAGGETSGPAEDGQAVTKEKSRILLWLFSSPVIAWISGGIWLLGILVLLAGNVVRYIKLRRKLLCSIQIEKNVYISDGIGSPIAVGFIRPRIYLPSGFPEGNRTYVLAHEKTHIRRGDLFFKMAAYVITCVHWFNPLVWYGFYLFGKDMEMACDEETVKRLGMEEREAYAKALLDTADGQALKNKIIFVAPMAFEEGDVRGRIKNIMKYRKTAVILSVCALVVCIVAGGVFFTKMEGSGKKGQEQKTRETGKTVTESAPVKVEKAENKIKGDGGKGQYFAWIKKVQNGMLENFQTVSTGELGISDGFIDSDKRQDNMGYAFVDLDSDGMYELLLGASIKAYYGELKLNPIYGIYGLREGQVVPIEVCGSGDDRMYFCKNGAIVKEMKQSNEESNVYQEQYLYYRYQDLQLQLIEMLTSTEMLVRDDSKTSAKEWIYWEEGASEAAPVKASKAWEIQRKYKSENVLFQTLVKKEELQKAREADALRVVYPNPEKLTFADLSGLLFLGRRIQFIIKPDGTFEGFYNYGSGSVWGYHYNNISEECYFNGKFSDIKKTGDYAYTMKCTEFQTEGTPGEERIVGDTLVRTLGAEDIFPEIVDLTGEEFRLYLPGMRESKLPDGYEYWSSLDCLEYGVLTSYVLEGGGSVSEVYSLEEEPVYEIERPQYTMAPVVIPEAVLSEEELADLRKEFPDKENFSFSELKGEAFNSDRVGSSTFLEIAEDGTFTVRETSREHISERFQDAPKGTIYEALLRGKFYDLKKVGPYRYTLRCKSLKMEPAGKERLEDGYRYVTMEKEIPGFEKYEKFELYLPGYRITELPEGYFKWSRGEEEKDGIIQNYYLYNVGTETMFYVSAG